MDGGMINCIWGDPRGDALPVALPSKLPRAMTENNERRLSVFYTQPSSYEGDPVRLYRSPYEIRKDISEINKKIKDTDGKINARLLLTDLFTKCCEDGAVDYLPELRVAISEAEDMLDSLSELCARLGDLKEELEDTAWALGI